MVRLTSRNPPGCLSAIKGLPGVTRKNALFIAFGFFFAILSVWQINAAQTGLDVINLRTSNPPVTIITPSNPEAVSIPSVLIAHGFAGSSILMRGFALTLAHAGYTTISWDFQGHGENPHRMDASS